jgi:hypothetical protein
VEFVLWYQGPLKASAGPVEKQSIRRVFHSQLRELWTQRPLCNHSEYLEERPAEGSISNIRHVGSFRLAPLATEALRLVVELHVTFLRPEEPGKLITQGGDIDNRLKTLFDALRVPKDDSELPPNDPPQADEDPFHCLLEDDNLITAVHVQTERLLDPRLVAPPPPAKSPMKAMTEMAMRMYVSAGTPPAFFAPSFTRPASLPIETDRRLSPPPHKVVVHG